MGDDNQSLMINDPVTNQPLNQPQQDLSAVAKATADLAALTANPVPEANLADEVEEFEEKQEDFQAMYNAGGRFKEQMDRIVSESGRPESRENIRVKEKTVEEVEEILTTPEVEKDVEGYVEKVEHDAELAGGVTADYTTRVLLGTTPTSANVTLPLTKDELELGLHQKVWNSLRWLAEWCVRQIKLMGGRAKLKGEN